MKRFTSPAARRKPKSWRFWKNICELVALPLGSDAGQSASSMSSAVAGRAQFGHWQIRGMSTIPCYQSDPRYRENEDYWLERGRGQKASICCKKAKVQSSIRAASDKPLTLRRLPVCCLSI